MLSWLLLKLSISAALISTVDPNCTDNALSFQVNGTNLTLDTENANKFLSCLCNTSYGCEFKVNNTQDKMDIILVEFTIANTTSPLSNTFTCRYSLNPDTVSCSLNGAYFPKQCVTSFNETGCDQIFNTTNCTAHSISLTWTQPYTVTCQFNEDTFYVNSPCIDDSYTSTDCENGAVHISTFSYLDNVTLSTNTRETFITTANVSGVYPIKNITENNWTIIVAVTVSVGVLFLIIFLILVVSMYRRRRKAKMKDTFLDAATDKSKAKTDGNVDAHFLNKYAQAKTTLVVEPYHVMQRNEIIKDVEPTNARTFTLQTTGQESTHYATVAKSGDKSVSADTLIVHSELKQSNEHLAMEKLDEESGSVYAKLGEKHKEIQNIYGVLKVPSDATVSDRISPAADDQIIQPCSPEHIYFELERENRNSDSSMCSDQNVK